MDTKDKIVKELIEWSKENDCGTTLDYTAIKTLINWCYPQIIDRDYIDKYLDELQTESGYLVKSADVASIIKKYSL